ncbi:retrovirus-related pol polyprotein LINE-1 [Tanacetum coccineum]
MKKGETLSTKKISGKYEKSISPVFSTTRDPKEAKKGRNLANTLVSIATIGGSAKENEVIPIYKNKGDAQMCSNYKGIKLLGHTMKLWERVIERRLRREARVLENQFGFMLERSTTEAIHLLRSLIEKYKETQRDLHMAFLDLEKAYGSVPRLHQGSTINPYLFTLILDELSRGIQKSIPWCMIFANDIMLVAELAEGYESAHKEEVGIRIRDQIFQPNDSFIYLGRRPHQAHVKRVEDLIVDGMRRSGRPKLRWEYRLKRDMKELHLSEDMTSDRNAWRDRIRIFLVFARLHWSEVPLEAVSLLSGFIPRVGLGCLHFTSSIPHSDRIGYVVVGIFGDFDS